jgi:hypothetical protein
MTPPNQRACRLTLTIVIGTMLASFIIALDT